MHSGGGRGCDVARCGGGFYRFCSRLVVDFDPMVVVVGLMLVMVDGTAVAGLMSVGVGMARFMGLFRP